MSFNNRMVSEAKKKLQKQEKICSELPEEQRKGALESEKTTSLAKELKNIEKSSKIEPKTSHSMSPVKRAPRLGDMTKTPSIEKNGRWIFYSEEVEEKSFDFGEISSIEDEDQGETFLNFTVSSANTTITSN